MGLFKKKCMYCRKAIEKNEEVFSEVKVVGYVGTFNKPFCSAEHVTSYNEELGKRPEKSGGSCCG